MKQRPEITERKARTILLNGVGWTARKNPAAGKLFFLDSFYRTYRELAKLMFPSGRLPNPTVAPLVRRLVLKCCSEQLPWIRSGRRCDLFTFLSSL